MSLKLAKVRYSASMSRGSNCFDAEIHMDGEKIGHCDNNGRGAGTSPDNGSRSKLISYLLANGFTPKSASGTPEWFNEISWELEKLLDRLFVEWLTERDYRKLVARKILFTKEGADTIYSVSPAKGHTVDSVLANPNLKTRLGADRILNTMPENEGLALYRKTGNE